MSSFTNPILGGFYPDPSVCRVGGDYYLVTSSFEFFPGVPIFHSRDLVNWRQLGHVLDRPSQLDLDGVADSRGIYAPTIRHHAGTFYMITTVCHQGAERDEHANFVCTAADPAGPWSEPHFIAKAPGIDPSLFFDEAGRAWYHGNCRPERPQWPHHRQIWLQELDLAKFRLKGERHLICDAADWAPAYGQGFCNAFEAPHLYRKDGWYYLLVAGGGTGWAHAMYMFRSRRLTGPYAACPRNPVMTHRHLPKETWPIHCPGHGDLVRTEPGEWWLFFLATRPYAGYHNYLGRETMLAPVDWRGDWPVVSPRTGRIERRYPVPAIPGAKAPRRRRAVAADFRGPELGPEWNFIRTPRERWWQLDGRPRRLRLQLRPAMLHEMANPSFIGRRVQDLEFAATTVMEFQPRRETEEAGLVLYKSGKAFFRLVARRGTGGQRQVCLIKRLIQDDRDCELAAATAPAGPLRLRIDTAGRRFRFSWAARSGRWQVLDRTFDVSCLAQVVCGGFTGIYVGPFAGGNGKGSRHHADFLGLVYQGCRE